MTTVSHENPPVAEQEKSTPSTTIPASSVANKDEAVKCFNLAKEHGQLGRYGNAMKMVEKSLRLYPEQPRVIEYRQKIEKELLKDNNNNNNNTDLNNAASTSQENAQETSFTSTSSTPSVPNNATPSGKESTKNNTTASSSTFSSSSSTNSKTSFGKPQGGTTSKDQSPSYTEEQVLLVKQFNTINRKDFYGILHIDKSASAADVKKSYKKLALLFHPDKNQAPGADEAFKAVGRAFAVLGDETKRAQYDQYGEEIGGGGSSPFDEMSRKHPEFFAQNMMDPDQLFHMFFREFASQAAGNPMGNGFFFASNFGNSNPFQQMHPLRRRRQGQQTTREATAGDLMRQLLPIFFLMFISFISNLLFPGR